MSHVRDTSAQSPLIRWIERTLALHEARATLPDGHDVYVDYVATDVGLGDAVWRGYVGRGFIPVGLGPRDVMQRTVEQRVTEALEQAGEKVGNEQHG